MEVIKVINPKDISEVVAIIVEVVQYFRETNCQHVTGNTWF